MPRNLDPNPSAANDTSGAVVVGSVLSRATALSGSWIRATGFVATRTATGSLDISLTGALTADLGDVSGQPFSATIQTAVNTAGLAVYGVLAYYNSAGTFVGNIQSKQLTYTANSPQEVKLTGTAPSGARRIGIYIYVVSAPQNTVITSTAFRVDQVSDANLPYNDGNSFLWSWDGISGSSTSTMLPTQINASDNTTASDSASVSPVTNPDSATHTDSVNIAPTIPITETETATESISIFSTLPVSDTATHTDQVSVSPTFYPSASDSATYTDIANIAASLNINDSAIHNDQVTVSSTLSTSDSGTHTDSPIVGPVTSDSAIHTDSSSLNINITPTDSATHSDTFSISATLSASDSATHIDSVQAGVTETISDNAVHTDSVMINIIVTDVITTSDILNSRSRVYANDQFTATDLIGKLKTEFIYEDQINYSVPIFIKPSKPQRVIAQNVFTREFFHWDVPIVNPELTFRYTAPNSFKGTLRDDVRYLTDVSSKFVEDATFLHYEEDGVIRQTTILMPFIDNKGEQMRQIEGIGFSDMPNRRAYLGPPVEFVYTDPMTIVRYLWAWCLVGQSINDFVFIKIPADVATPVRVGKPKQNVSFTTGSGENVNFDAGPVDYNTWEASNVGEELNKLYKETPIEYTEQSIWNTNHDDIYTTVAYKYPRVGAARNNTFWRDGENIIETDPEYVSNRYPRSVTVIGAGEGPTAIRATCAFLNPVRRIPYDIILENEDIQNGQRAFDIAKFELLRLYRSRYSIKSITVDTTHPNAKLGTWGEGDDIFPETYIRNIGRVADWHRITEYTYYPANSRRAILELAPSASFGYGANLEVAN